jgi:hypothetical protein
MDRYSDIDYKDSVNCCYFILFYYMEKFFPDPWICFGNINEIDQRFIFLKGPFMFFHW